MLADLIWLLKISLPTFVLDQSNGKGMNCEKYLLLVFFLWRIFFNWKSKFSTIYVLSNIPFFQKVHQNPTTAF
jgi:hypothetical protein